MARYPDALWLPIPENDTQGRSRKTQVILHSAVGPKSLYRYWQREGVNVESTLWVALDGDSEQYLDSEVHADANRTANARAISVETADDGNPDQFGWTPPQIETLANICAWAHDVHGIPLARCASHDAPGIGFHTMWGAPSPWTPVAKTCPGKARIPQFPDVLARAREIVRARETPKPRPYVLRRVLFDNGFPYQSGKDVERVQRKVGARADGRYGPQTADHVKAWQRDHKLTADGAVGPQTAESFGWEFKDGRD